MAFFGPKKRVNMADIHIDPGLCPNHDPTFDKLFEQAMNGITPVYFAAVPLGLCIPADPDYRPDLHAAGAAAVQAVYDEASQGKFPRLIVYPRGIWVVVSDDYIPLFAALRGRPDCLACWVLGRPDNDLVKDLQGPIAASDVRTALGL